MASRTSVIRKDAEGRPVDCREYFLDQAPYAPSGNALSRTVPLRDHQKMADSAHRRVGGHFRRAYNERHERVAHETHVEAGYRLRWKVCGKSPTPRSQRGRQLGEPFDDIEVCIASTEIDDLSYRKASWSR